LGLMLLLEVSIARAFQTIVAVVVVVVVGIVSWGRTSIVSIVVRVSRMIVGLGTTVTHVDADADDNVPVTSSPLNYSYAPPLISRSDDTLAVLDTIF
jgi:hypothetical protein